MDKKYKTLEGVIANMRSSNVDFIQQYQNALSQDMCDYFINKFENLDKKGLTNEGRVQRLEDGKVKNFINSEAKSSKDIYLSSVNEEHKWGYYYPHYDSKSNFYRIMAIIIYLNDIQYGGETEFPILNRMIIPKKGSLVIFPSVFTHWHYGRKSNIDKYVLVSHVSKYPSKTEEKEKE